MESFKHRQNIMDDKLNTTYKLCQQKLFVVCKLKVPSVADRLLRLFGSHIESVLLSLSSICCFAMLTSLQQPQTCTDSNITRLSTLHRRQSRCSCAEQSDPERPFNRCVTLLHPSCRCRSWGLLFSYLGKFARQILVFIFGCVIDLWWLRV